MDFACSRVQFVYTAGSVQCTYTSIRSFNWTTDLVPVNKRGRGINLLLQKDVLALADGDMSPIILLVWGLSPAGPLHHMLTQQVGERQSGLPEMWRFSCDTHHLAALFLLCYSLLCPVPPTPQRKKKKIPSINIKKKQKTKTSLCT